MRKSLLFVNVEINGLCRFSLVIQLICVTVSVTVTVSLVGFGWLLMLAVLSLWCNCYSRRAACYNFCGAVLVDMYNFCGAVVVVITLV